MWTGSEAHRLRSLSTCSIVRHLVFGDEEVSSKLMGTRNGGFFCSGMRIVKPRLWKCEQKALTANLAWLNRTDRTRAAGLYANHKTMMITPPFARLCDESASNARVGSLTPGSWARFELVLALTRHTITRSSGMCDWPRLGRIKTAY